MASGSLSAGCGSDDRRFTRSTTDSTIRSWIDDHEVACVTRLRRTRPSSKRSRRASGSSRSITCSSLAVPPGSAVCSECSQDHARRSGVKLPFTANTPYINTISVAEQPTVSRQPGNRAAGQEPRAVERAGDGGQGQQARRGDWRSYLDLRVGGHAVRGRPEPLLQGEGRRRTTATSSISRGMRRPASTPARFSRVASGSSSSSTSAASCCREADCRRIPTRG